MILDTRAGGRWVLNFYLLSDSREGLPSEVSTGTIVEVLNAALIRAWRDPSYGVLIVREGQPDATGLAVCVVDGCAQVREIELATGVVEPGNQHNPGWTCAARPRRYDAGLIVFCGGVNEIVDAAEWGRVFYSEGSARDMLSSELALARVEVEKPYASPEDIALALAAYDAEYARDAVRQNGAPMTDEAEFLAAQARLP